MSSEPDKNNSPLDDKPRELSFSLPQVLGGALAAATAAAIGSTLGVAGTIIGAAVASIIGAVGGTLYTVGITKTSKKVGSALSRGVELIRSDSAAANPGEEAGGDTQTEILPAADETALPNPANGQKLQQAAEEAELLELGIGEADLEETKLPELEIGGTDLEETELPELRIGEADPEETEAAPKESLRTAALVRVIVVGIAIFLLAFTAITGWEMLTGRSLSGQEGTTIGGLAVPPAHLPGDVDAGAGSQTPPTPDPVTSPSTSAPVSPDPSLSPSPDPSESSSESPPAESASPSPKPSEEPSTTQPETPSGSESATPTTLETPDTP
ncbi:MAG: hypothetical protein LBU38_05730 [Propionibacteriaceae bacterium]|jgi:hypothetical protein|nr:hypothetical protein [Propionibacteriaceae bacterium]